jgi:hypothetical protein
VHDERMRVSQRCFHRRRGSLVLILQGTRLKIGGGLRFDPRSAVPLAAILASVLLFSCGKRDPIVEMRGHLIRTRELEGVSIGQTTAKEVVARFGEPDEHAPDGSLTYRATRFVRTGPTLAAWSFGREKQISEETVTFRFENGALAKICRKRS